MKSKLILVFCLIAIALITGCDKKEFTYDELFVDGRVIGSINGVVSDDATNSRLANVLVTWVAKGGVYTTRTNDLGYYGITNLDPGYYDITFSDIEGYAIGKITVEIETLDNIGIDNYPTSEDFYYSVNENVPLYQLNSSLKGMVYASPSAELYVPAIGVTVVADFNNYDLADEEYTVVTDSNGAYTFTELPATANVDLRTMPFSTGGFDYAVATKNNVALITGGLADAGNIFLSVAPATPFLVSNNFMNGNFPLRSGLHMTFSKAMQTDGFEISLTETVVKAVGPIEVAFTFNWTDGIVLVVDPVAALNAGTSYTLSLTGTSQDGNSFDEDYVFTTQDGLVYTHTNLEVSQGSFIDFPIDGTIELGFNMIVDLANTKSVVNLYHETDDDPVVRDLIASTSSLSEDLMTVLVDPDFDLEPDQDYYISYTLYSTIPGDYETGAISFTTSSDLVAPAQVTGFALDEATDWTADLDTDEIDFKWNTVANAVSYKIFAQDNAGNTDSKEIASFNAVDVLISQTGSIDLSDFPEFDWLADDGWQTPFANGTQLTFKIVAVNSAGMGPFSTEIVVADETGDNSPSLGAQQISADNTVGATAIEVTFAGSSTEYLHLTTPASWTIAADDTISTNTVGSGDITFEIASNMRGGIFTITVPSGQNYTGDTVYFFFNDGSGNISDTAMMAVLTGTNFATTA
ncbi:MAG: carboxypeptidase-like regulatory domain-containing protein, partial [candidate division Zixibacteria bacterium]|nr:carboxypeptidase-like regulatory domain-containing protein [candidate division Zixibacteria bacterium]